MGTRAAEVEAALVKEAKDSAAMVKTDLTSLSGKMEGCFKQIEELHNKYSTVGPWYLCRRGTACLCGNVLQHGRGDLA